MDREFLRIVGARIKTARNAANMSQTDLALKAGYTEKSSISRIESGNCDLPLSKLTDIAKILEVSPMYLMGWEEPNNEAMQGARAAEYAEKLDKLGASQREAVEKVIDSFLK